jgi:hypothetical protein
VWRQANLMALHDAHGGANLNSAEVLRIVGANRRGVLAALLAEPDGL